MRYLRSRVYVHGRLCGRFYYSSTGGYPKAKKPHKCKECRREIKPGERYLYEFFISTDGDPMTHKTCSHCNSARKLIMDKCRGFIYGEIFSDLIQHSHTDWGFYALRLAVGMRRKWERFDGNGLMGVL